MSTLVVIVVLLLLYGIKLWLDNAGRDPISVPPGTSPAWMQVDITRIRIALAADARPFLQTKLLALAQRGDTRSKQGLHRLLLQVCRALSQSESAWLYASIDNHQPMSTLFARTTFDKLALDARATFTDEVIRSANGVRVEGPEMGLRGSKERDGEGVVVITLVVAAKCVITDVTNLHPDRLRALLFELIGMSLEDLVALEVSWMPAEADDLVSTRAAEQLFPKLIKLPGVVGGHRICSFCQGPHTAELKQCPHCGAPVPRVE